MPDALNIAADPAPVADAAAPTTADTTHAADAPPATNDAPATDGEGATTETTIEYEPFQLPEGMAADEELMGEFSTLAKELKLPQSEAQKFADLAGKMQAKAAAAHAQQVADWGNQVRTDAEIGGDALPENLGVAKKALQEFGTPALRELLDASGLGNHPEVIRAFVKVGKAISEDNRVVSGTKAAAPADPAKRLFPNQS